MVAILICAQWLGRVDPTRSPVNLAEQGVVLAQARSHAFDVYPREEYVAPGGCSAIST